MPRLDSNSIVQQQLDNHINKIERKLKCSCLTFLGELRFGVDDAFREAVKSIKNPKDRIVIILETPGGYAEVTQRISDMLRKSFTYVDFIIPNFAMSAGTILVMSGDSIYMDDYSILGPIDPQVQNKNGHMVPALGYLRRYEELMAKADAGNLNTAELNLIVDGFDQGELYKYHQAEKLSETLLVDWLVKYKFKDWHITKTRKVPVTAEMKADRARQIAKKLSNTEQWHTHGRGISMEVLKNDINIEISDFSKEEALEKPIRQYYQLLQDYMGRNNLSAALHVRGMFIPLGRLG